MDFLRAFLTLACNSPENHPFSKEEQLLSEEDVGNKSCLYGTLSKGFYHCIIFRMAVCTW